MAESFENYLKKLQDDQLKAQRAETFDWYLRQIRELAARNAAGEEPKPKEQELQSALHEARQEKKDQKPGDAKEEVEQDNVIETNSQVSQSLIGKMLFYQYDAKWKEKLPYWDKFPLVFLLKMDNNSSLGMNMHYLPPLERARLMTVLYTLANSTEPNINTKLLITYKVLNESSKFYYFKPCIKRYLHGHIRSRIMTINPEKWNRTLFLPLASWQKAPESKVYQDSINQLAKARIVHG